MPKGIYPRPTAESRFWAKVNKDGPLGRLGRCWLWTGSTSQGYGLFWFEGQNVLAHRYVYGPVPDGLQIDHLCRRRTCVRRTHLQPVTGQINTLRGDTRAAMNAAKTHCLNGHPLSGENLYDSPSDQGRRRRCRLCTRNRDRQRQYASVVKGGMTT